MHFIFPDNVVWQYLQRAWKEVFIEVKVNSHFTIFARLLKCIKITLYSIIYLKYHVFENIMENGEIFLDFFNAV